MSGPPNQLKLPFPPDPPEGGLYEHQIGLGGLFAATTLCAILAAAYARFGFWGLMASVDALLLVLAGLRYCEYRRAYGIPLPPWTSLETMAMLGMALWLQALVAWPVVTSSRRRGAAPPAAVPAASPALSKPAPAVSPDPRSTGL